MPELRAVLLDVGGVFHVPDHEIMVEALARADFAVDRDRLDRAHFTAAQAFGADDDRERRWKEFWPEYVRRFAVTCGVDGGRIAEACDHLGTAFTTMAPWSRILAGSREGLARLAATGVRLGVVSNADGTTAERLAREEVLQVGPGAGVEIETLIDSGVVGIAKPDPRIFHLALDALGLAPDETIYVGDTPAIDIVGARRAGIVPVLMDPFALAIDAGYDRVESLSELAIRVTAGDFGTLDARS